MSRTALITGGARGIGQAIADALSAAGMEIVAPSRAEMDLGDAASVERYLVANAGMKIDILINNAGINVINTLDKIDPADWAAMLQINLTTPLRLIQAFSPGMRERGWGRIVNISSIFSLVTKEGRAAYSTTKAGLNGLTRTTAVELAPYGIMVNALCPGYVETELTRQNNTPEALQQIAAAIPAGRLAQPEELAQVAAFLCSERNTYLTGQTVVVDGGFTSK